MKVWQRGLNEFLILHCVVSLFLALSPFLCHHPSFLLLSFFVSKDTLEANDPRFPWEPIDDQL